MKNYGMERELNVDLSVDGETQDLNLIRVLSNIKRSYLMNC